MDIIIDPAGFLSWGDQRVRCALGRNGVTSDKTEGDLATPIGCFPLRRLYFRADRTALPATRLPATALLPDDGWCDDPQHPDYNTPIKLPFSGRHEILWRDDGIYDVIVVLGHNDDPIKAGAGSAIFLHVARDAYTGTEGCVALSLDDLLALLRDCAPGDRLCVKPMD